MKDSVLGYSEITLLSNGALADMSFLAVLGYSEITLLSNEWLTIETFGIVLGYSEITLLSNGECSFKYPASSFRLL